MPQSYIKEFLPMRVMGISEGSIIRVVATYLVQGNKVFFVKERDQTPLFYRTAEGVYTPLGSWGPIGGQLTYEGADFLERAKPAAQREVIEETKGTVVLDPNALYELERRLERGKIGDTAVFVHEVVYGCELIGSPNVQLKEDELEDGRWMTVAEIEAMQESELRHPKHITQEQLRKLTGKFPQLASYESTGLGNS